MAGELILVNPRHKRRRAMTAKQAKYFGKRRKSHARRNPSIASIFGGGGRKRRRHHKRTHARRNPIVSTRSIPDFVNGALLPAAVGAAGAVALDILWSKIPLPDVLTGPTIEPITRIAFGLGLGMVGGMVAGRRVGNQLAAGALIVTMTDLARRYVVEPMTAPPVVVTPPAGTSAYVGAYVGDNDDEGLGWYSAGQASPRYAYG